MELGLQDRVALVTGAGQGIGRQICLTLAQEGAQVAVNDIVEERVEAVMAEIAAAGGRCMVVVADVTGEKAVKAMVQSVVQDWGPVDILVNDAGNPILPPSDQQEAAAGGAFFRPFAQGDRAFWDAAISLVTYGVLNCSRAVIGGMMERRRGCIVNISSNAGRVGRSGAVPYSMCKGGLVGLRKALAQEAGPHSVTVNCVSPGATETEAMEE
jgi:3-oxoacyl-[acyl-carrier protein] reductase